jgi:hypothetical protein
LATILVHAFNFSDIEDEEETFSSGRLSSDSFLKGTGVTAATFPPFSQV